MLKRFYLTVYGVMLFSVLSTFAQSPGQIDSLEQALKLHVSEDTAKADLLIQLSYIYYQADIDKSLERAQNAYTISKQLNYIEGMARSSNRIGYCLWDQSKFDEADKYLNESLRRFEELGDERGIRNHYYDLGIKNYFNGRFFEALKVFEEGERAALERNDSSEVSELNTMIAEMHLRLGNYTTAVEHNLKALSIQEKIGTKRVLSAIYSGLLRAHGSMSNFDEAHEYSNKALRNAQEANDSVKLHATHSDIGVLFLNQEKFQEALIHFNKARNYIDSNSPPGEFGHTLINLSEAYMGMRQFDKALELSFEAIEIFKNLDFDSKIISIIQNIGSIHYEKGDYQKALHFHLKAVKSDKIEFQDKMEGAMELANTYEALGNYKKAYESHVQYKILSDSIVNKDNIQKVTNLEAQYKFDQEKEQIRIEQEKKDLLAEQQILQAEAQRNYLIGGVLFVLLLAGAIARAYYSRKKAADVLRKLNEEIAQVNHKLKMTDKYRTRFFANINHDIRTPLTLIRGYHEQIVRDENNYLSDGSEKHLRYLKKNTDTLYHMSQEIQNLTLLDESKLSLSWQAVEIVSLTQSLANMFHSRADLERKSISCVELPSEEITVHLDRAQFERILGNLLSNAFKYSDEGASISVSCKAENEMLYFEVTDTGYGISEEHLPHIFDRFYQSADNPYKTQQGVGLGLALVKELVVLHGGELSVVSKFGEGSTFSFSLPYNLDKEVSEAIAEEVLSQLPGTETVDHSPAANPIVDISGENKSHTVLVVDDHEEIRDYIVSIIGAQYHIKQAAHGQQALELLEKEKIDLVITDLMMPWLDGFELVEKMRENEKLKHIPVMVVSARTTEEDKMKILSSGINEFMTKPFSPVEMEQRIENMLSQKDSTDVWSHLSKDKELRSNLEEDILKKVHDLVLKKIDDGNLTVAVLAAELCASERKVHDLINSLAGMPPKTYIRSIRLEYAKHLIDTQKVSTASEAAQSIGMNNSTQFKNQYVKKFGTEPFR